MANHGIVVGGSNLEDAYRRFETLELCALTESKACGIGTPRSLSDEHMRKFEAEYGRLIPEMRQAAHPADELDLRAQICSMVQRGCAQGLMISSYGTVSARWRKNDFLITPRDVSRWDLQARDLVQICNNEREPGKLASRSVLMHAEIYRQHPEINSIFVTQSPNIMAFSVTGQSLDGRSIPESWLLLQDVAVIPFSAHFDEAGLTRGISLKRPVTIVCNDAVIVAGTSLLNAFDRLEVVESSARASLLAAKVGQMKPISKEHLAALRERFM